MSNQDIPVLKGRWIILTDNHLWNDEQTLNFLEFLDSVDWALYKGIIFLGDFFHVWAVRKKFVKTHHGCIFEKILTIKNKHSLKIFFFIGNRDILVGRYSWPDFPEFDKIFVDHALFTNKQGHFIHFEHGDTINSKDLKHMSWRKNLRMPWLRFLFNMLPRKMVWTLLESFERNIKEKGNKLKFSRVIDDSIFQKYLANLGETYNGRQVYFMAGHIHPDSPIIEKYENVVGIIFRAWMDGGFYYDMAIDSMSLIESCFPSKESKIILPANLD